VPAMRKRKGAVKLNVERPITSLREATGATAYAIGKALEGASPSASGRYAEESGENVAVSTVRRAAQGLGGDIEILYVPGEPGEEKR
jgi:hypothetical protein